MSRARDPADGAGRADGRRVGGGVRRSARAHRLVRRCRRFVSTDLASGLTAALGAAVFYGSAPVAQSVAARRSPAGTGFGLRLLLRLVRDPIWLAGVAGELVGFLLEAYAFSVAPATLVAPAMACDTVVFVLLLDLVTRGRPSRRGLAGATTIATGTTLLA